MYASLPDPPPPPPRARVWFRDYYYRVEVHTVEQMHSRMRHGIQVVHSQPPGVRLLHNLSLLTVSFLVSIYNLASQTHREAVSSSSLVCGSRSGSDLSSSVVFSLPFTFCDCTYLCILTLDQQTHTVILERQRTDQPTRCACL